MSGVFVDTSALYALLCPEDRAHTRARSTFADLRKRDASLVTSSYVLVETFALVARRLGHGAVREFRIHLRPLLEVEWVDELVHEEALDLMLERARRELSLVDAASFVVMRRRGIGEAFAFDRHFEEEGFDLV